MQRTTRLVCLAVLFVSGNAFGRDPSNVVANASAAQRGSGFSPLAFPPDNFAAQTYSYPLPTNLPAEPNLHRDISLRQIQQTSEADPWKAYRQLWWMHATNPKDRNARRILGLGSGTTGTVTTNIKFSAGRRAPASLRWRGRRYLDAVTDHFDIHSTATRTQIEDLAADLERFYWVWTQVFFPLWDGRLVAGQAIRTGKPIPSAKNRLRVIYFGSRSEYVQTLRRDVPGIERSTGYYSDQAQAILLFASDDAPDVATRYHELTHQLFREATSSRLGRGIAGDQSRFWLVEGIACFMESTRFGQRLVTIGGPLSGQLQYGRRRFLVDGDTFDPTAMAQQGRVEVQRQQDLGRWYTHAAALTHTWMDGPSRHAHRPVLLRQLADLYRMPSVSLARAPAADPITFADVKALLTFDKQQWNGALGDDAPATIPAGLPSTEEITELCLAGSQLSPSDLEKTPSFPALTWLDLTGIPVTSETVRRILPTPQFLRKLALEQTQAGENMKDWFAKAVMLEEFDGSFSPVDSAAVIQCCRTSRSLNTLWLTGSRVDDQLIDALIQCRSLQQVDLQRTQCTAQGLQRLRTARPDLSINPLQLVTR